MVKLYLSFLYVVQDVTIGSGGFVGVRIGEGVKTNVEAVGGGGLLL